MAQQPVHTVLHPTRVVQAVRSAVVAASAVDVQAVVASVAVAVADVVADVADK